MSSNREYLDYILGQLKDINDITYRPMMGEFILYYRLVIIGGIYDNRFLVKATNNALKILPNAIYEKPYENAKGMILVEEVENKELLKELIEGIYLDLSKLKK